MKHTVTKPIFQEVREVITPYRKITQEVQPVQEEIRTIVGPRESGKELVVLVVLQRWLGALWSW